MGIKKANNFIVDCDVCGYVFSSDWHQYQYTFDTREEAKKDAKKDGWKMDHGKLMCPWCVESNRRQND